MVVRVWITVVKNPWNGSGLAFDDAGDPTAYFWVHLLLAVTSFFLGTGIGVLGLRGVRAARHGNGEDRASGQKRGSGAWSSSCWS
ncbi:SCO4848 family membrane protein [Streptomyces zaomyceticus]|uniref:SCO4848 family membrane protein n=1 Tax=Streptomyces zaomyceticus TaxID=68286 RepID=UPI00341C221A